MMWKRRDSERGRGSGKREMGCCHFKGLWTGHPAFCRATAAQEFGNLSCRTKGLELMHANVWPHICSVTLILCLPFFWLSIEWMKECAQYAFTLLKDRIHAIQLSRLCTADTSIDNHHDRIGFTPLQEPISTAVSSLWCGINVPLALKTLREHKDSERAWSWL